MEDNLIRFRVDPEVKAKAKAVCAKLGFELPDVMRAFLNRLVRDGTLPFDLAATSSPLQNRPVFSQYDKRLWERMRTVDGEVALALLWRYIAERTALIHPAEKMRMYPVSRAVNNTRNDDPRLILREDE